MASIASSLRRCLRLAPIALTLFGSSCGVFRVCAPRPSVSSISPTSLPAGGPQFFLTVNGRDFHLDSFVLWNSGFRPTAFVNSHQLIAQISAADIAAAGKAQVAVFTPPGETEVFVFNTPAGETITTVCGGGLSNALSFTINP